MGKEFWGAVVRFIVVLLATIGVLLGIFYGLGLVYPFLIGLLLALLYNPLVNFLEAKLKFPRWLAVTIAIILLIAILATIVTLVVIEIISEINKLTTSLPQYVENYFIQIQEFFMQDVLAFYDNFTDFYSSLDPEVRRNIEGQVESFTSTLVDWVQSLVTTIMNGLVGFFSKIPTMATAFVISLLASFFISKDWPKLREKYKNLLPTSLHERSGAVIKDLRKAVFGFVKAQLTLISITFVIVLIGFFILRVEYALTIALIIGLVDLLPYLGTGLIFVPWIIYLFITGEYGMVIGLSILYAIVLIQRQMMEPKILGTNVGLDPLLTLVALFVGFQLFGLIGLIIGPASMVILGALHRAGVFRDLWTFIKGKPQV
ncbi:sporulation integral membrane protein YtvI [Bacillus horti]|uniref:Sporulation integral membrane protein YtvI n=1 Tax=Caldalkalibacillus horti TaxID=77523 RepID=A0ABT9VT64_9BACI|nr:sporulation integral membrane protein YtvI [Bacillus horti]MDQ0164181.1 sporulation integral membrane protein YtvI [Bacillus horti]